MKDEKGKGERNIRPSSGEKIKFGRWTVRGLVEGGARPQNESEGKNKLSGGVDRGGMMVYGGGGSKAAVVAGLEFSCILPKLFYVNNKIV